MADARSQIDMGAPLAQQGGNGHDRWHPDIAPRVRIASGSMVEMDSRDGVDGQISRKTKAADIAGVDLSRIHPITGSDYVEGA